MPSASNPSTARACFCIGPQNGDPVCPCMMPHYRLQKAKDRLWDAVMKQKVIPDPAAVLWQDWYDEYGRECG